jgi:hypothetical protein
MLRTIDGLELQNKQFPAYHWSIDIESSMRTGSGLRWDLREGRNNLTNPEAVRHSLARHRDKRPIGLETLFQIDRQIDLDFAKMLENDLTIYGDWERRRATPALGDQLPNTTGLYMFLFQSHMNFHVAELGKRRMASILYIGRAGGNISENTLRNRYRNEYANYIGADPDILWQENPARGRQQLLKRYMAIWPLDYWFLCVSDRDKIESLEDRLIKLYSPPLNSNGRLRVRASEPRPAFLEPK